MKTLSQIASILTAFLIAGNLTAHHSFSAFDFQNETEITGELTRFDIIQPHVMLALEVSDDNGDKQKWVIESVVPRQWRLRELDADFAQVGETVTLIGWRDRDGADHMMLKTMIAEKGTMVVRPDLGPNATRNGANAARGSSGEEGQREGRAENRRRARELEEASSEAASAAETSENYPNRMSL